MKFSAIEFYFYAIQVWNLQMKGTGKNIKILFKYFVAPALAAWLFYSLYKQIRNQPHLYESLELIRNAPFGKEAFKFWMVVVLLFFNWGFEALKWQYLTIPLERISFLKAFKSVLSGVTLSINTPNRIGEYGGRIIYLKEGNRLKGISLSIAGSISQLIITLLMGCIALFILLVFYLGKDQEMMGLSKFWIEIFLWISLIVTFLILLFFFKMAWLVRLIEKLPPARKLIPYIKVLGQFENKILLRLLFISFVRFTIFVFQYLLLLKSLNVEIEWFTGLLLLSVLFLVMAIVPSFAIADIGIRGQVSIALLGMYNSNTIGILATIFGIWILNLFIPAVVGSLMILSVRLNKEPKH